MKNRNEAIMEIKTIIMCMASMHKDYDDYSPSKLMAITKAVRTAMPWVWYEGIKMDAQFIQFVIEGSMTNTNEPGSPWGEQWQWCTLPNATIEKYLDEIEIIRKAKAAKEAVKK